MSRKQTTQSKNDQKTKIDISPKKTYRWSRDTRKDSQHHFTKEMQIKTTVRYHLTLVRMAIIKKSTISKCWRGCGEKGDLLDCWWECKVIQPLWRTVWRVFKILKIELPYDPAIPLLGIYPERQTFVFWTPESD